MMNDGSKRYTVIIGTDAKWLFDAYLCRLRAISGSKDVVKRKRAIMTEAIMSLSEFPYRFPYSLDNRCRMMSVDGHVVFYRIDEGQLKVFIDLISRV